MSQRQRQLSRSTRQCWFSDGGGLEVLEEHLAMGASKQHLSSCFEPMQSCLGASLVELVGLKEDACGSMYLAESGDASPGLCWWLVLP